ncbi:MFS transporter [Brevundimonas naejangsanensis]|uniref:MFS transporter n=1 Tax=Brevundimonas naejangsanensis TaxID=588932 RepID=UPI00320B7ECA
MNEKASGYGEFRQGWPVVVAAMLGIGLGLSPVPLYTTGALAPHLAQAFGWGFGQIMAGLTVMTLTVLLAAPVVGMLADRFGVRLVALISVVLFGISFMGFALSNGSLVLYYATWAVMAVAGAGTLPITWTRAVNNWFEARKGLALGVALLGTGLFGFLVKPLTAWLVAEFGWRGAYVAIGALPLILALPIGYFWFKDKGSAAGESVAERRARQAALSESTPGLTFGQTLREWRFWLLGVAFLLVSFAVGGSIPNMEKILGQAGFGASDIVWLASLIGLSVIIGRILGGWLIDRFWAPGVAFIFLAIPALAYWHLAAGGTDVTVTALSIFVIGFAAGLEYDLMAFLVARYFGMKGYGGIYGALYGFFALGAGFGPVVFGAGFDKSGSYAGPLHVSAVLLLVSAVLLLMMGRYRRFDQA